jgi:hypothetical protein
MLAVPSPCDVRNYQILLCTEKTTRTNYRRRCTAALQTAQKRPERLADRGLGRDDDDPGAHLLDVLTLPLGTRYPNLLTLLDHVVW